MKECPDCYSIDYPGHKDANGNCTFSFSGKRTSKADADARVLEKAFDVWWDVIGSKMRNPATLKSVALEAFVSGWKRGSK